MHSRVASKREEWYLLVFVDVCICSTPSLVIRLLLMSDANDERSRMVSSRLIMMIVMMIYSGISDDTSILQ